MRQMRSRSKDFRFTGTHMAVCMVLFFSTIFAVNMYLATLASKSWTGLVVKNSYVASQNFNAQLEAAKAQQLMGWQSQLEYKNGEIRFALTDRAGNRVEMSEPVLFIGRPAFEQQDQNLSFQIDKQGDYFIPIKLEAGHWDLRITGLIKDRAYRRDARILVNNMHSGIVQ